jgi:hypothetical protein
MNSISALQALSPRYSRRHRNMNSADFALLFTPAQCSGGFRCMKLLAPGAHWCSAAVDRSAMGGFIGDRARRYRQSRA